MTRQRESVGREPGDVPDYLIIKGPLTLEQVGRLLGVSRERVRQIESSAMRKLLDGLRSIGVDAPDTLLEVHTDRLADIGPKRFPRLPKKTKPGGAVAAARAALAAAGIVTENEFKPDPQPIQVDEPRPPKRTAADKVMDAITTAQRRMLPSELASVIDRSVSTALLACTQLCTAGKLNRCQRDGYGLAEWAAQPIDDAPRLRQHPNGQWYVPMRINGRRCSFYFGKDRAEAERRKQDELSGLIAAEQTDVSSSDEQMPLFKVC